jgi:excisionase family DNA binding protein
VEPLLLHISKAAEKLGLSVYQVRGLCESGRLPFDKVGRRTYINAEAVDEYAEDLKRSA